jgi:hypothetical protein
MKAEEDDDAFFPSFTRSASSFALSFETNSAADLPSRNVVAFARYCLRSPIYIFLFFSLFFFFFFPLCLFAAVEQSAAP